MGFTHSPGQAVCRREECGFVVAFVDLVPAELLADAAPREPAVPCTQLDSTAVFFEDVLEIGTLDPAGEFGRDLGKRAAVVEVEIERLVVAGDDLRRQVLGLDHRTAGRDRRLLDHVLELPHVSGPVVSHEP